MKNDLQNLFHVETTQEIFPRKALPFTVYVKISISNDSFCERLKNTNSHLYFEEWDFIGRLFKWKQYRFQFADIVSIKNIPGASPERTFSYEELFNGVTIDFESEKKAFSLGTEIHAFLTTHLRNEQALFQRLLRRAKELEVGEG